MSQALVAAIDKKAADTDKKKEVEYVRGEKHADEKAQRVLQERYGGGARKDGDHIRKRVWNCPAPDCGFRNVDTRDVCGKCLTPNPAVMAARDGKAPPVNALRPVRGTLDPFASVVHHGGRCYRTFNMTSAAGGRRRPPPSAQQPKPVEGADSDDEPSCGAASSTLPPCAQRRRDGDDDDDDDDDDHNSANDEDGGGGGAFAFAGYGDGGGVGGDPADESDDETDGIVFDGMRKCYVFPMRVPARFFRFIIGKHGKQLADLGRMTGATVTLKEAKEKGEEDIADISGPNRSCVLAARIRIESIMMDSETKVSYTHFLSIPLAVSPAARASFGALLQDMSRLCTDEETRRIDPFMFQSPARVHLTLLMLRLHSQKELDEAKALLTSVVPEMLREIFSSSSSHSLSFRGCDIMNDDPSEAHVVYLDLVRDDAARRLVSLIQRVTELFIDARLALPKDVAHSEKLHATVVNSKWRGGAVADASAEHFASGGGGGGAGGTVRREAFDASEVLRLFGEPHGGRQLGAVRLERIDLSVLGGGAAADGYYARVASAAFP